jgi:hypothetical protein
MVINDNMQYATIPIGNIAAGGNIGTAATTVDICSSFKVTQTTALQTLTLPAPTVITEGNIVQISNAGTASFTMYGIIITTNTHTRFIWQNGVWTPEVSRQQGLNGNIIARVSNVTPVAVMTFDNFKVRLAANVSPQIATIVGSESVSILTEQEYPGGSFTAAQAGSSSPTTLTTTYFTFDDSAHVAGERFEATIQKYSTGQIFKLTMWRLAAIAGNWSGWVEEIGTTTSNIFTASNGLTITGNNITLTRQERVGRLSTGDVGAGSTTGTATGDMTAVAKNNQIFPNRTTYTVTFAPAMPSAFYNIFITPVSVATPQDDNDIKPIVVIGAATTTTSFQFMVEETAGVIQGADYHIFLKQVA